MLRSKLINQMGYRQFLTIANTITLCRILTVPFFISVILYYTPENDYYRLLAFAIFMFAILTDALDGYIARVRNQKTLAGAILDPLADKLLLISAFICLYKVGVSFPSFRFPLWLVVIVISRDVILLIGTLLLWVFHRDFTVGTSSWGKCSTAFQYLCVGGVLLQVEFFVLFWYCTAFFSVVSGIDYIRFGIKRMNICQGKTRPVKERIRI